MALEVKNPIDFYYKICKIVEETNLNFIDSVLYYCEQNGLEPESVVPLINTKLKAQLRDEAEDLNFLPKTTRLPL